VELAVLLEAAALALQVVQVEQHLFPHLFLQQAAAGAPEAMLPHKEQMEQTELDLAEI
jgi:hypothetical protein